EMAKEANKKQEIMENLAGTPTERKEGESTKKKRRGVISRLWNVIFNVRGDDFEKRLQNISKEEALVLARMKKRSYSWRRMRRNFIIFSVIIEVIAVSYAIMTTRSLELNWKMRAFRVLPMFLLPLFSSATYSALVSFTRMRDRKDQKTLERLHAERQAKIDELKERTNYYTTQQLIQRYDPDPAAKAAAASVLASKLGAESGLKVYLGKETNANLIAGKSNDVEIVQSSGLRNRKQVLNRSSSPSSTGSPLTHDSNEALLGAAIEGPENYKHNELVVDHYNKPKSATNDEGWIARVAALLVGEDPTQSYALICGNCHMHNGLARKEDFPYITYYCPHCHALNRSKEQKPGSSLGSPSSMSQTIGIIEPVDNAGASLDDKMDSDSSIVTDPMDSTEGNDRIVSGDTFSPIWMFLILRLVGFQRSVAVEDQNHYLLCLLEWLLDIRFLFRSISISVLLKPQVFTIALFRNVPTLSRSFSDSKEMILNLGCLDLEVAHVAEPPIARNQKKRQRRVDFSNSKWN
ncbi:Lunapark domain, partial [Dillenia turbinata]